MKTKKKNVLISLLAVSLLLLQTAGASIFLPDSSLYQGQSDFDFDGYLGKVEFGVYDTQEYPDEWGGANGLPEIGEGRYIYAYQIFAQIGSTSPIDYFNILGIGEGAIIDPDNSIDTVKDIIDPGLDAVNQQFKSELDSAYWRFEEGTLVDGQHSWFLVLSSDHNWTTGTYSFENPNEQIIAIPNPEPATVMLLGFGALSFLLRRRKSV